MRWITSGSVSYTHLDVYKRQLLSVTTPSMVPGGSGRFASGDSPIWVSAALNDGDGFVVWLKAASSRRKPMLSAFKITRGPLSPS